jgi:hypothetical protein
MIIHFLPLTLDRYDAAVEDVIATCMLIAHGVHF